LNTKKKSVKKTHLPSLWHQISVEQLYELINVDLRPETEKIATLKRK
jgi:hypothetical protein